MEPKLYISSLDPGMWEDCARLSPVVPTSRGDVALTFPRHRPVNTGLVEPGQVKMAGKDGHLLYIALRRLLA